MTEIKVGDIVTWRSGKSKMTNTMPLGIANCEVLEFGTAENGEMAARLKLPPFFDSLIQQEPHAANAYVADLELEMSRPEVYRVRVA